LRAKFRAAGAPYVQDVVLTGLNRDWIGALVFPRLDECRALAPEVPAEAPASEIVAHPAVRAKFQALLDSFAREATGSSTRIARATLLEAPPSIDASEITDKGSINQRAVLKNRAALVDALYADAASPRILAAAKESR
jgi:feruloyl-CoA synthase